jgi:hypothetical protein
MEAMLMTVPNEGDEPDTRSDEERRRAAQKMRDEDPMFHPMTPDDPGWIPPGTTEVIFLGPRFAARWKASIDGRRVDEADGEDR